MLLLLLYATVCTSLSIGAPKNNSELNEPKEFYPNWVPFKNKHGDELGEFLDVAPKAKVKKRLAPPMNFILRAVAEPDGEDYYDKGQGEGDSEDDFEKRDWSDLNRPVQVEHDSVNLPARQNLSDIDGIVNLIIQPNRHNLARAIQESVSHSEEKEGLNDNGITEKVNVQKTSEKPVKSKPAPKGDPKYEDDIDYVDAIEPTKGHKPESSEEEAEKKNILDSVDDLKDRHATEQRLISEKAKEEEFDLEIHERDQMQTKKLQDKYAERTSSKQKGVTLPDYEEYEEKGTWKDKYTMKTDKSTTTKKPVTIKEPRKLSVFKSPHLYIIDDSTDSEEVTTRKTKTQTKTLFKNDIVTNRFSAKFTTTTEKAYKQLLEPQSHTDGEPALFFPKLKHTRRRKLKLKSTPAPDSSVAETVKEKTAKRLSTKGAQRALRTTARTTKPTGAATETTETTDTTETTPVTTEVYKSPSSIEELPTESRFVFVPGEDYKTTPNDFAVVTEDRITDEASTNTDTLTDAVPAATGHEKEEQTKEPKEYHVEKGGGREYHSSTEEEHEEHGKKAYEIPSSLPRMGTMQYRRTSPRPTTTMTVNANAEKIRHNLWTGVNSGSEKPWYYYYDIDGLHKDSKSKKGHHDKEDHLGKYEDRGGFHKEHSDEKNHYGAHHHEEHGKKHAKYEESGKHSKGHSTKGSHDIHKKDEYEKKVEFFEEEGDSADEEKHGGFNEEKEHKSGGKFAKGDLAAHHDERRKGESGHFEKGGHANSQKGYKQSGGHDSHGRGEQKRQAAAGQQAGKKWIYHHGSPAKTSNLVIIDRRGDKFAHGPNYFG